MEEICLLISSICTEVPIRTVKTCVPTSFSLTLPNPYDRETYFFVETLLVCGSTAIAKRSCKVPNDACLWHHGTKVPKFGSSREGKFAKSFTSAIGGVRCPPWSPIFLLIRRGFLLPFEILSFQSVRYCTEFVVTRFAKTCC